MKKLLIAMLLSSSFVVSANAETLFACKTTKGKQVLVEQQGDSVFYAYGKNILKPELKLEKSLKEIGYNNIDRPNNHIFSLSIKNGKFMYNLERGSVVKDECYADNCSDPYKEYGFINVTKNNKTLATIDCIVETVVFNEPKIINQDAVLPESCQLLIQLMQEYNSDLSGEIELREKLSSMNEKAQAGFCTYKLETAN